MTATIYTALNVSAVPADPSVACVQWTSDGQACISTKTEVHILTPDLGINIDALSVIRGLRIGENTQKLGWFRNMIEFLKAQPYIWPELSQEWPSASLGSIDLSIRAVACSPSNVTSTARCAIVTLSSNMDLTLWLPTKNHLRGEWLLAQSITSLLVDKLQSESLASIDVALRAQTVSVTWCSHADFGIEPAPVLDSSLLVTGNRDGFLTFLRFDGQESMQYLQAKSVTTHGEIGQWITQLSVSCWGICNPGICFAQVAYAKADGSVWVMKIMQNLIPIELNSTPLFSDAYDTQLTLSEEMQVVFPPDKRAVTALIWVRQSSRKEILVFCKPGTVYIWYPTASCDNESISFPAGGVIKTFRLQTQRLSVGSTTLLPASAIQYIKHKDALLISVSDGSLHVIVNVSNHYDAQLRNSDDDSDETDMEMDVDLPSPPSSESRLTSFKQHNSFNTKMLSRSVRQVFIKAEAMNAVVTMKDVNTITGMSPFDGGSTFLWLHEATQPADLSYKHHAKHNCMFIVASLWDDDEGNDLVPLQDLKSILRDMQVSDGHAPIYLLRPHFFYFSRPNKASSMLQDVLAILHSSCSISPAVRSPNLTGTEDPASFRSAFRHSLHRHLFGWNTLAVTRMKLSFADFIWKNLEDKEQRAQCGHVAQQLLTAISHTNLKIIIRHLISVATALKPNDVPYIWRIVIQGLMPGSPEDLTKDAQMLSSLVQDIKIPEVNSEDNNIMNELCPACNAEVPLKDITSAVCSSGHFWSRCTVTSFVLATPYVRTCIGCSRKTFLQLSSRDVEKTPNWLPQAARGWIVEELLEAVNRCLYCGNGYVSTN